MTVAVLVLAVLCLAFANGANDNFKGVATLFGSGAANYRGALVWATVTTLLGSLTAVVLAEQLLTSFSGRGLVADSLAAEPAYVAAVGLGTGLTVLLATRVGMPISTTHGLVGALVGAGWTAGSNIHAARLAADFFAPLLISPVLAIVFAGSCYLTFRTMRQALGITRQSCFCIGSEAIEIVPTLSPAAAMQRVEQLSLSTGTTVSCYERYQGRVAGIEVGSALDRLHYLSAGLVSFARGLNDTPKIAALLLIVPQFGQLGSTALVGVTMALGGWLGARRIAELMSRRITPMNPGQGFTANLVTGLIVVSASRLGLPVSTTHVSCGALFGIGTVTRQADGGTILKIVAAWFTTLPTGAALGAICYRLLNAI